MQEPQIQLFEGVDEWFREHGWDIRTTAQAVAGTTAMGKGKLSAEDRWLNDALTLLASLSDVLTDARPIQALGAAGPHIELSGNLAWRIRAQIDALIATAPAAE